jgi:prephenate dehydratase
MKVVHLGPNGSHSHSAALKMFRSKSSPDRQADEFLSQESFENIFRYLDDNPEAIGVIPLENTIGGDMYGNFDKTFTGEYKIVREIYTHVDRSLLTHPSTNISDIKKIYLTFQDKIQCSDYLDSLKNIEYIMLNSSSEGANIIYKNKETDVATIGSEQCRSIYNLTTIQQNLSNYSHNYTRFVALMRVLSDFPPGNANKCTIILELKDEPGALHKALKALADQNYNITKIESHNLPAYKWKYKFLIDFEFEGLLDLIMLEQFVTDLKVIGIYRKGREVEEN